MSWTATILALTPTGRGVEVTVVLTDGVSEKFQQSFQTNGTQADLLAQGRGVVANRSLAKTKGDLVIGEILDVTPLPEVPPPLPDPDRDQFRLDLAAYDRALRNQTTRGLSTPDDLAALKSNVQKALDQHPDFEALT